MRELPNIFCQPTPVQGNIVPSGALVEWSLDGVTWQAFPAPASTQIYVQVSAARDFTAATYIQFEVIGVGGQAFTATGMNGSVQCQTNPSGIGAGIKDISVLDPNGNLDCGTFTFS